jgi:hypothetical protein
VTYRVEIYNVCARGRAIGTGWLVAEVMPNGCRRGTYAQLGSAPDAEKNARDIVRILNAQTPGYV